MLNRCLITLSLAIFTATACAAEPVVPSSSLSSGTLAERAAYFESIAVSLPQEPVELYLETDEDALVRSRGSTFKASFVATPSTADTERYVAEIRAMADALEAAGFEARHHNCGADWGQDRIYRGFFEAEDGSVIRMVWGGVDKHAATGAITHRVFEDGTGQTLDDTSFEPIQPERCF